MSIKRVAFSRRRRVFASLFFVILSQSSVRISLAFVQMIDRRNLPHAVASVRHNWTLEEKAETVDMETGLVIYSLIRSLDSALNFGRKYPFLSRRSSLLLLNDSAGSSSNNSAVLTWPSS